MGFSSYDDVINQATTNSKSWIQPWNRITPTVMTAGRWYDLFLGSSDRGQGYHGNYVKNWGFDSAAEWTAGTGWAWGVTGVFTKTAGTASNLTQTSGITLESGVTYTVIITTSGVSAGQIQIQLGGGTAGTAITTSTTTTQAVVAGATQSIDIVANSTFAGSVDNFIVIAGSINGQSPRFAPYSANMQGSIWPGDLIGGTATKHLLTMSGQTSGATTVPITLLLVDLLGCYARIDGNTSSALTLANTLTLPRYTTGAGVMAYSVVAPTTTGATAHNTLMTYTNQANAGTRNLPQTVAATVSAVNSHIYHTGTAANNIGPFLPLQAGDTGIRK